MGLFKKRKSRQVEDEDYIEDLPLHSDEELFGDDPFYVLSGHRLSHPPPHRDLYKYWMYDGKVMLKSQWESLGFEIRDFNPKEEGYGDENIWYYFRPITEDYAEERIEDEKNLLNIYEQIQQERESGKIALDNTTNEIKSRSYSVREELDYIPKSLDIEDFKIMYNDLLVDLKYLKKYENFSNFSEFYDLEDKPSILYNRLANNFEQYLLQLIERTKEYNIEKASKMKTNSGKVNTLSRLLDDLTSFLDVYKLTPKYLNEDTKEKCNSFINEVTDLINTLK